MNKRHEKKFIPFSEGIKVKKQFGQHFLRESWVTDRIVQSVSLTADSSVFEIGCGDGFLTRAILQKPFKRLWIYEIDPEWASYVRTHFDDARMEVFETDILDLDFSVFKPNAPWTLLSNLPYQITFPILHMLQRNRALLKEGVIMVQEEVAQKIVKTSGRGYGFPSLFFQYYFDWKVLDKISPTAFYPPPKVFSRLLHFKPRIDMQPIPDEAEFWRFIKVVFKQPRRTLRNNLSQSNFNMNLLSEDTLALRAQQMDMDDLLAVWDTLRK